MPEKADNGFAFVAGVLVGALIFWWIRRRRRHHAQESSATTGRVMGVSTPGVSSGPAPAQVHVLPTGI